MKNLQLKRTCLRQEQGIDGCGHCRSVYYYGLLLCVVMKDSLTTFIQTIVAAKKKCANPKRRRSGDRIGHTPQLGTTPHQRDGRKLNIM